MKNPREQQSSEMIAEADEHFVEHCAICHSVDGRGHTTIGRNLYPKVPDMTQQDTQQLSDGELYYIIFNGIRLTGMPAWGSEDKPEVIWDLVALIRRLRKVSPEELKRLQMIEENTAAEQQPGEPATKNGEAQKRLRPARTHTHTSRAATGQVLCK